MDIQNRNQRIMRKSALAVSVAAMLGLPVAANAASATNTSSAEIVQAIGITAGTALDFGSVVADSASAGTVAMDAAGTRTCGTVTCVAQDAGTAASFDVTGQANYQYSVTLPTSTTIADGGGTNQMTVDTFTDNSAGTLDGTGADTFNVGATLGVGAAQAAGSYTGNFDVTVNYQ